LSTYDLGHERTHDAFVAAIPAQLGAVPATGFSYANPASLAGAASSLSIATGVMGLAPLGSLGGAASSSSIATGVMGLAPLGALAGASSYASKATATAFEQLFTVNCDSAPVVEFQELLRDCIREMIPAIVDQVEAAHRAEATNALNVSQSRNHREPRKNVKITVAIYVAACFVLYLVNIMSTHNRVFDPNELVTVQVEAIGLALGALGVLPKD
jgi:hypothetical protein